MSLGFSAIRVRLYPNKKQRTLIEKTFGCCRLVFNKALAKNLELYEAKEKTQYSQHFINQLPELKKRFSWLSDVDSQALQQAIRNMDVAFKNHRKHNRGKPKFKSKHGVQTFRSTQANKILSDNVVKIGKTGSIKCSGINGRYANEKIKSVTVVRDTDGKYYASILIEKDTTVLDHAHEFLACGIDVGIAKPLTIGWENNSGQLCAKHTGIVFTNRLALKEDRRKRYQRQLARKQKGSNGFKRAKLKVARAYAAERHYREDWHKKTAHYLCSTFTEVHFEDLKLMQMTKATQQNADGIRKGRAAKAGLNRELLRMGFCAFMRRVQQKAEQYGTKVVFVNPRHTSQCCSACGHTEKANRKTQSRFECQSCGFKANADKNASWNILRRQDQNLQ